MADSQPVRVPVCLEVGDIERPDEWTVRVTVYMHAADWEALGGDELEESGEVEAILEVERKNGR